MGAAMPAPRARHRRPLRVRGGTDAGNAAGPAHRAPGGPRGAGARNWKAGILRTRKTPAAEVQVSRFPGSRRAARRRFAYTARDMGAAE
jgi:hypothetical protein